MDRKSFIKRFIPETLQTESNSLAKSVNRPDSVNSSLSPQSTIAPYTGSWTENEVIHLLKRLSFGAVKEDVDYFKTISFSAAVDEMLNTKNNNRGFPLKNYTPNLGTTPTSDADWSVAIGRTWVNTITSSGSVNSSRRPSLKDWWFELLIKQPRSIEEKMILFLSTFVAVEFDTVGTAIYCYNYINTLRTHATGNYKTLIKAITLEPAMLVYLNGKDNSKTAPDENYGRELQELFTIGKGPDSHYTESDVQAAAKVLTGYRINSSGQTYFDSSRHDTTNKTFSPFYNNTIITGRSGADGQLELDDLLAMIFATSESAKFICRRIYRFFVYGVISPEVEQNIITPMAALLQSSNYELKPVLSLLFKSEHFFDVLTQGAIIKSPLDFIVGMARETRMKFPPSTNIPTLYKMYDYLLTQAAAMDQNLGDPPNVSGWQAYYLDPVYDQQWLNTDTYSKRSNLLLSLTNGYTNSNQTIKVDWIDFARRMSAPENPNTLVQDFNTYLLRMQLSQTSRDTIKTQTLLSGQATDNYWTNAWNTYISNPNSQAAYSDINTRLQSLIRYFMNLEEFHLM